MNPKEAKIEQTTVKNISSPKLVEKAIEKSATPQLGGVLGQIDKLNNFMYAVVLILLVMVAGMLIDVWNNKSGSLENFANQINQQNLELQRLNDKLEIKN